VRTPRASISAGGAAISHAQIDHAMSNPASARASAQARPDAARGALCQGELSWSAKPTPWAASRSERQSVFCLNQTQLLWSPGAACASVRACALPSDAGFEHRGRGRICARWRWAATAAISRPAAFAPLTFQADVSDLLETRRSSTRIHRDLETASTCCSTNAGAPKSKTVISSQRSRI